MSVHQETYGRLPGVRTVVIGGGISNVAIGREQKLVMFGRGDPDSGIANENDPQQIGTRADAGLMFGEGTELATEISAALNNKGNIDYIYGVIPSEIDVQGDPVAGGTGTLENAPIVEDEDLITVTNTTSTTEQTVEFRYESPPDPPTEDDTVSLNPVTGAVEAGDSDDYDVDYAYLDWDAAFDSADTVLNHAEVGIYAALADSESVAETLADKLTGETEDDEGLRGENKLAVGVAGAQPNMTTAAGEAGIDAETYTDAIDNEAMFLPGPVRRSGEGTSKTILGGIAGRFAGNELTNPIRGDTVNGYGRLTQSISRADEDLLREANVIPVADDYRDGGGGITLEGHHSTSSADDWNRTFQNRRVVDLIVLAQRSVAKASIDNLMRDQQLDEIEAQMIDVFEDFARAGLIRGDPDGERRGEGGTGGVGDIGRGVSTEGEGQQQPYFAEASRRDIETVTVASGFSPIPVVTGIENRIQIADEVGQLSSTTATVTGGGN